jgi:hypothetical protein
MICLSPVKIAALAKLMASLKLNVPFPLPPGLGPLQSALALNVTLPPLPPLPHLPALPFPALKVSELAALGGAANAIKLGLGIDLFNVKANAQLAAFAKSFGLHGAGLGLGVNASALASLSAMASLAMTLKAMFGINLLSLKAGATLTLPPLPPLPALPPLGPLLSLAALVSAAKLGLGIDLLAPGGVAKLSAALSVLVSLKIPELSLNLGPLANLLLAVALVAQLKALGIDLTTPGGAAQLAAALSLVASLKLPALPALPALPSLALLKLALGLDLKALLALKLGGLNLGGLPNLGNFALVASLAASLNAHLGINILCPCPHGF